MDCPPILGGVHLFQDGSSQELIEPAKPAREHVTSAYLSIDGEIQTWRPYAEISITRIWSFWGIKPRDLT